MGYGRWIQGVRDQRSMGQAAACSAKERSVGAGRGPKLQLGRVGEAEIAPLARIWEMGYGRWIQRVRDQRSMFQTAAYSAKEGHVGAARGPKLQLGRVGEAALDWSRGRLREIEDIHKNSRPNG